MKAHEIPKLERRMAERLDLARFVRRLTRLEQRRHLAANPELAAASLAEKVLGRVNSARRR